MLPFNLWMYPLDFKSNYLTSVGQAESSDYCLFVLNAVMAFNLTEAFDNFAYADFSTVLSYSK